MDPEAKTRFDAQDDKLDRLLAWAMRHEARIEELEKDRFKPTTARVRALVEHDGIPDPA